MFSGSRDVHIAILNAQQRAIEYSKIDPKLIGDICVGTVLPKGPVFEARTAALAAGIP